LEDQDARLGIGYSQAVSKTRGVSPPAAALASYRALAR
jgi:hypothetical protein